MFGTTRPRWGGAGGWDMFPPRPPPRVPPPRPWALAGAVRTRSQEPVQRGSLGARGGRGKGLQLENHFIA